MEQANIIGIDLAKHSFQFPDSLLSSMAESQKPDVPQGLV